MLSIKHTTRTQIQGIACINQPYWTLATEWGREQRQWHRVWRSFTGLARWWRCKIFARPQLERKDLHYMTFYYMPRLFCLWNSRGQLSLVFFGWSGVLLFLRQISLRPPTSNDLAKMHRLHLPFKDFSQNGSPRGRFFVEKGVSGIGSESLWRERLRSCEKTSL